MSIFAIEWDRRSGGEVLLKLKVIKTNEVIDMVWVMDDSSPAQAEERFVESGTLPSTEMGHVQHIGKQD